MAGPELDELIVANGTALRAWLLNNHATSPGVWLVVTRKGGSVTTPAWQQGADEALCFGWIDGHARKRDEANCWRRFTPRRPRKIAEYVAMLARHETIHPQRARRSDIVTRYLPEQTKCTC